MVSTPHLCLCAPTSSLLLPEVEDVFMPASWPSLDVAISHLTWIWVARDREWLKIAMGPQAPSPWLGGGPFIDWTFNN